MVPRHSESAGVDTVTDVEPVVNGVTVPLSVALPVPVTRAEKGDERGPAGATAGPAGHTDSAARARHSCGASPTIFTSADIASHVVRPASVTRNVGSPPESAGSIEDRSTVRVPAGIGTFAQVVPLDTTTLPSAVNTLSVAPV